MINRQYSMKLFSYMEKAFNLKVSVRIGEGCRELIDQVSFNHLILCGREPGQGKKFQVDKIYSPSDNNQKLFENILRVPSNLIIQGFSSVIFCIGSPNSGKTYSLAGKKHIQQNQSQPGIITYMMRRLFSKFKHQDSLYSTYSFWCRFLFVQRDRVTNLNGQHEKNWQNKQTTKILLKNYSHFEQLMHQVYSNNNNKRHTIIELILQKQSPNQQSTTSSVTFVQFGSFFYNCPYRQAEELSMQNDIQSTLHTIKNLSKAKQNGTNIFNSSLLTKLLKQNFLRSYYFQFLGLLDNSYQNSLKTLNFLDIIVQKKEKCTYIKNIKQQIKRQEIFLKGLYQKHRRVLNLLSRCIGMELGYLDKKKKRNFDGPVLNTFYKTCQKIKFANQKKLQNEKELQQIRKNIDKQKLQLNQVEKEYEQKFSVLSREKQELINRKKQLDHYYQSIVNPIIKFSSVDNSIYSRQDEYERKSYKKFTFEEDQQTHPVDTERDSKQGKSIKMFPSNTQMTTRKNIHTKHKLQKNKEKSDSKYQRNNQQEIITITKRRIYQIKSQIAQVYQKFLNQQIQIQLQKQKIPLHYHSLHNKIKNRASKIDFNFDEVQKCYAQQPVKCQKSNKYQGIIQNLKIHDKIIKDIINNSVSMGAISMKSCKSQKQFKIL